MRSPGNRAPAALARRHPRPARGPLDPRVHGRPVRPLRPCQPARAAGPLHRAPRPRRHRARVPGRPQRHDRLALGDDDRDARRGAGRARSTCSSPGTPTAGSATCAGPSSCWRMACTRPASRSSCATGGSCAPTPTTGTSSISEAAGAEKYSRRLSERITDGYAAKFDHRDDPGGHAGLGFRRSADPPHTLEVDPATMAVAVGLFERYALGNVSATQLEAETGLAASRIRMILMNPLYNGWIRRHRGRDETRRPAPWRSNPPVSDDLWARVEEVRRAKTRGGGPRHRGRVDLLAGLLECVCGRRIRSDGRMGNSRAGCRSCTPTRARPGDEGAHRAPQRGRSLSSPSSGRSGSTTSMRAQIIAVLSAGERPVDDGPCPARASDARARPGARRGAPRRRRLPRPDGRLRGAAGDVGTKPARDLPAHRALEWLDALAETWQKTDLVEEKSDVIHADLRTDRRSRGRASSACASRRRRTGTDWRSRCQRLLWRARQDSNLRPSAPEADALSTELQARGATRDVAGGQSTSRRDRAR